MITLKRINTSPTASYILTVGTRQFINPSYKLLKHHLDKHGKQIKIIH